MKLIEVIGPNGAGKSTLHDDLLTHGRFLSRQEALVRCARHVTRQRPSWRSRLALGLMLQLAGRSALSVPLHRAVAIDLESAAMNRLRREYSELSDVVMKLVCSSERPATSRLRAMAWFGDVLQEALFFRGASLEATVVLDESLCHMIYALSSIAHFDVEMVEQYFTTIPAPSAVVHVVVDPDRHLNQVRQRAMGGHVMPGHVDIIGDERALVEDLGKRREIDMVAVRTLMNRNVPCVQFRPGVDDAARLVSQLGDF